MTAILPPPEDVERAVIELRKHLPGRSEYWLHVLVETVLLAALDIQQCTSVSPWLHVQCELPKHSDGVHKNAGRGWVDGSTVLLGRHRG